MSDASSDSGSRQIVTAAHHRLHGDLRPVERRLLAGRSSEVAPRLLGWLLVRPEVDGTQTIVRLVETEAYREDDPASHSYRGSTPRNEVMFGVPGHLYVYFTYGMHFCMNVSTEPEGTGSAVLLRAGAVVAGEDHVRRRRGAKHRERDLLRGPGRLAQGLGVDRDWNGIDLLDPAARLRLAADGWTSDPNDVRAGPRVGIRTAAEKPWRYWVEGLPEVSRYTRHPRAG